MLCWAGPGGKLQEELLDKDLVGAPWRPGECPPDNDRYEMRYRISHISGI